MSSIGVATTKRALYFGWADSGGGHFLQRLDGGTISIHRIDRDVPGFPWAIEFLDTGLLRNRKVPDQPDGRVHWTCGGTPLWLAFFWWDRSGDKRSNSKFRILRPGLLASRTPGGARLRVRAMASRCRPPKVPAGALRAAAAVRSQVIGRTVQKKHRATVATENSCNEDDQWLPLVIMKRLDNGEGNSPLISIRLPQKTTDLLDALIAQLPPHPVGPPPRSMVIRAVIDAGIEALAIREGIKLGIDPKPINEKVARASVAKTSDGKTVHRASRARAERRAETRRKAGCTCKSKHVPTCKLYRQPSSTAA